MKLIQTYDHPCCPPLNLFQFFCIFPEILEGEEPELHIIYTFTQQSINGLYFPLFGFPYNFEYLICFI